MACKVLKVATSTLNCTQKPAGNQCNSQSKGDGMEQTAHDCSCCCILDQL